MTREAFEQRLLEQTRAWLSEDEAFLAARTSRERCAHACRVLRLEHTPETPYELIGQLLELKGGTVRKHWQKYKKQLNADLVRGRKSILSVDQMTSVVNFLRSSFEKGEPATIVEACRFIRDEFGIEVIPNTLQHALARDGRTKPLPAHPMEDSRMAVTIEQIEHYFDWITEALTGTPAHFVFNMDEMGHQDWADAHTKICYVPSELAAAHISYPVSRKGKRITLIACIAADGSFLRPALVISRKTFEDELMLFGYTEEKIDIYDQPKAYIDRDIFITWLSDTFVPEVAVRREKYNYSGPVFLIMDNCTSHSGDDFEEMCTENGIIPILIPPHSSNQLQMLDLSIFGVTKRYIARANRLEKVNIQTNHIHTVLQGFYSAATPANIVASFLNWGISLTMDPETRAILCTINPQAARCLLHAIGVEEHEQEVVEEPQERDPNLERFVERAAEMEAREVETPIVATPIKANSKSERNELIRVDD
jgi:hypothetical protein